MSNRDSGASMRIGVLAATAGLSRDAIRFYERAGLIESERLPNGFRDFPPESVAWLHYVRTAQRLGFSLAEIARHGRELRDAPDGEAALSALLQDKVRIIDDRMRELAELRSELERRIGTGCPMRPDATPGTGAALGHEPLRAARPLADSRRGTSR